jgi:hypothetical protein
MIRRSRDRHDARAGHRRRDAPHGLDAGHGVHVEIHDDDVRPRVRRKRGDRSRIGHPGDAHPRTTQQRRQAHPEERLLVNHEDANIALAVDVRSLGLVGRAARIPARVESMTSVPHPRLSHQTSLGVVHRGCRGSARRASSMNPAVVHSLNGE